jgi:hypothetical protein
MPLTIEKYPLYSLDTGWVSLFLTWALTVAGYDVIAALFSLFAIHNETGKFAKNTKL